MSPLVLVLSILVALSVGVTLGVVKASLSTRGVTLCVLYFLSIAVQTVSTAGDESWGKVYTRLLVLGAIPALVCHVLPAMIAYSLTLFIRKRRRPSRY